MLPRPRRLGVHLRRHAQDPRSAQRRARAAGVPRGFPPRQCPGEQQEAGPRRPPAGGPGPRPGTHRGAFRRAGEAGRPPRSGVIQRGAERLLAARKGVRGAATVRADAVLRAGPRCQGLQHPDQGLRLQQQGARGVGPFRVDAGGGCQAQPLRLPRRGLLLRQAPETRGRHRTLQRDDSVEGARMRQHLPVSKSCLPEAWLDGHRRPDHRGPRARGEGRARHGRAFGRFHRVQGRRGGL
mmetsp:Transcript_71597/g.190001  ORF Transcript_71597/g.190001 Transcript_71597/m.190001 type:complete len:239 (+) Transcript_71597:127-843(+)